MICCTNVLVGVWGSVEVMFGWMSCKCLGDVVVMVGVVDVVDQDLGLNSLTFLTYSDH